LHHRSQQTSFYEEDVERVATIPSNGDGRGASGSVGLLEVEDYEPFRRFVCSTLEKRTELQVVGEVSDGLEAVQKAEELRPDLILLDVGLPTLNGIEPARRIRKLSPQSKILFVSQETSTDVVQEALGLGAMGYVAKTNAGIELLVAVEAVCQSRRFVSAGLAGHVPAKLADRQTPKRLHLNGRLTSSPKAEDG
jgi:DNA-binding NarL/FixJ family response regulator